MIKTANSTMKNKKALKSSLFSCASALTLASALLISGFSTAAYADDSSKQSSKEKKIGKKEKKDFLKGLNFLLVKEKGPTPISKLPNPKATAGVGEPGLSLRVKEKKLGDNFFYLRDFNTSSAPLISTIDDQASTAIGYNSSRLGIVIAPSDKKNPYGSGFEMAVEGSIYLSVNNHLLGVSDAFIDREYAIGLSLGYSGFNLDASVLDQTTFASPDYSGYNVGFSYRTNKLWARVGYKDLNMLPNSNVFDHLSRELGINPSDLSSLELQAVYRLSNSWRVTGGLRYSVADSPLKGIEEALEKNQAIYLGTRWSF